LPYQLVDEAGTVLGDVGSYLLSPKDLAGITVLSEFVEAGVSALKIEGRMKSPEYVALVTGVYRGALDRAATLGESYEVRDGEMSVLSEAFSRGFTEAYLIGERGAEMMSYLRPSNRGVPVGRVAQAGWGRATIVLDTPIDAEDTIEFWTSEGRFGQRVGPMEFGGRTHTGAPAGARVAVSVERAVRQGDRVFRVRNAALSEAARRLFEGHGPEIPLSFRVRVSIGDPLRVEVADDDGRRGVAEGDVVEAARTRAVTAEDVIEHVGRLGNTPYSASGWDVELSPNAGVGFSALHALRRSALAEYEREVLRPWADRQPTGASLPALPSPSVSTAVRLAAVVASVDAAHACLDAGADEAHVPSWALDVSRNAGIVPVVPRICHDSETDLLYAPARSAGGAVAGTLGALWRLAQEGAHMQAHWSLNALNAFSVAELADAGASFVWLSPELSVRQIAGVAAEAAVPVGVGIVGRQELMVTEHCILTCEGRCAENCAACSRRARTRWLKDRKGYRFPVVTDPTGRSHLYNSVRLDATAALPELLAAGISALRLDLETEDPQRAAAEVARVRSALDAALAGRSIAKPDGPVTTGHLYRGVR
jgi:putative protease